MTGTRKLRVAMTAERQEPYQPLREGSPDRWVSIVAGLAQCPASARSSMDRATGFYPVGWGFESLRARFLCVWFRLMRDVLASAVRLRGFA